MNALSGFAIGLFLSLLLSACGFQLRGQADLPVALAVIHIDHARSVSAPPSPLVRELQQALRHNGATVTDRARPGSARLRIVQETYHRRTLATQRVEGRRYDLEALEYTVTFSVFDPAATPLIEAARISARRDILHEQPQVLGRAESEVLVRKDMRAAVIRAALRRLQALRQP